MTHTLPNYLTLLRILAVPFFAIALWYGLAVEACVLFVAAGITDLLDGFIARRFNQRSSLGAILDPAADKLLMTTAFVLLAIPASKVLEIARIPMWVAILAVSRDVLIGLVTFFAFERLGPERFAPSLLGKLTTLVALLAVSLALLLNATGPKSWAHCFFPWIYYLMAVMVLASGIQYFFRAATPHPETV